MEIAIVGAGIGGLALAHGLVADGHDVRVLERSQGPASAGAGITIFSNGAAALGKLGIDLDGAGGLIETLEFTRSNGRRLVETDFAALRKRSGFGVRNVPRPELVARLRAGLPSTTVRYDHQVESVEVDTTSARVLLASGERVTADVVVGADGHRSAVRRTALDPIPASDSGWATWQGLTAVLPDVAGGTRGLCVVGDAGLVGMLPAGNGLVQWWFDALWDRAAPEPQSPLAWLREKFGRYAEPVPTLLAAIEDGEIGLYPHVLFEVLERWGTGPMTLIGDAAHVFPPSQAQGANQAIEDAWMLTQALRLPGPPAAALRRYELSRIPHVRTVSGMASTERTNLVPPTVVAMLARRIPAGLAGRVYRRLIYSFSSVLNDEQP